jgi:hypothetical protein
MLASREGFCCIGLLGCIVKCKDLLKKLLLRLEELQMITEEDIKHVPSYVVYMTLDKNCFGNLEKKFFLKT